MPKKIGEIRISDQLGSILFFMDGEKLAAVHNEKRFWIDDSDIFEDFQEKSTEKKYYFSGELVGIENRDIRMPLSVLKTKDVARINRRTDENRQRYTFIYEHYTQFGLIEFGMFQTIFLMFFDGRDAKIDVEMIERTEDGIQIQIPDSMKEIPVKVLDIPEEVLVYRDRYRAKVEYESHFKYLGEDSSGIEFYLHDDAELVMRYEGREATATDIEMIDGKPAVKAESLQLNHLYVELPADVEKAFKKVLGAKIPEGLQLDFAGRSLLNGADYFKFNKPVSDEILSKVKPYMEYYYEPTGLLSGWLTKNPEKIKIALGLN